jgi:glutaconate CoA-transferase subunit A
MFMFGLYAAAHNLPFLPTYAGLGSDVLTANPSLKTIVDPYEGHELVAVPALKMDVALVHLQRADSRGNALYLGGDPYFDDLYAKAADRTYVSCERLVDTADLLKEGPVQALLVSRAQVTGVVETPGGWHFTTGDDDRRDEKFQKLYVESAGDPDKWVAFRSRFLDGDEAAYQDAVRAWRDEQ